MATIVIMPRQGQSVESCIITTWHKKVGETVAEGDLLFSYETDKSAFDEPAPAAGTILAQFYSEGDVVTCLENVCVIGTPGEDISSIAGSASESAPAAAPAAEEAAKPALVPEKTVDESGSASRLRISPRARNLALQSGADLSAAVPTGPHGRIIERDVNALLDAGKKTTVANVEAFLRGEVVAAPAAAEEAAPAPAAAPVAAPAAAEALYDEAPLSNVRRVIARSMHASLSEMAQLTLNSSFDATALLQFRAKLKKADESLGLGRITLNDMILWTVARVLLRHPDINAQLVGDNMRRFRHANIGMAVDTDRGLLVPVLSSADTMTLKALSDATKTAAAKAREGKLSPDEMSGGSFTVSNLGSLGIESFTPVINPPQTAILGVCCTVNRQKADGSVYPAMGLSLTFDHRAVDGAPAARFLKDLCQSLENFDLLLAQ